MRLQTAVERRMQIAVDARRASLALRASAAAVVIAGVAWLVHGIELADVGAAFARARAWPIVVAAVINFAIIACKAIAWRILLADTHAVGVPRLFRYTLISCAASVILPLRAGELVRLWLLRDRDGVSLSHGASIAVAEKLLDIVALVLVLAPLPVVADIPVSLAYWIAGLAAAAIIAIWVARALAPRLGTEGWHGGIARGFAVVRDPRRFVLATGVLVAAWLVDLAMIELVLWSVGLDLPAGGAIVVLFAVNLAIAIPSTPGQLGALEIGAVVGLRLLRAPEAESLAFALLYHALQVIPVVVLGLVAGAPEIWKRRS